MEFIEFVAEQNRLNRTGGLRRDDAGGEILPQDYPMSPEEREYLREADKRLEEQMDLLEYDLGSIYEDLDEED